MLEVEGLTKLYGDRPAVQGLTFRVGPGEILGLVGPNGAGKTTTLRTIAGILPATSGKVVVAGHDLGTDPLKAKGALAFVPDEPSLFEYLTAEEHLEFTARLYGCPDDPKRREALLDQFQLLPKRRSLADELSRGMKQKLTLACALIHDPALLLMDEPLTGLDPVGIRQVKDLLLARARAGAAIVLSSHLLPLIEEICSRLLFLHRGAIAAAGTQQELAKAYPGLNGLEAIFLSVTGDGEAGK
ncbi:MAG TPA: ABC transporter ATP-binding protein [Gemmatimonadales bacterium]|nr:ABC transporter ATP-binding protein [Gemmatimonadales bacterium]